MQKLGNRVLDNGQVLGIYELDTGTQVVNMELPICSSTKLVITGVNNAAVNTPLPLMLAYQDWQNNPLPNENRPIHVNVTGPGQAQELVLTPTNGQVEFDFVSAVTGTYTITATAEFPCDAGTLEVTVQ